MKASVVVVLLVVSGSECVAQATNGSGWAIEISGAAATFRELYPTDCCGPTQRAHGSALTARAMRQGSRLLELGAELGATAAGGWRMNWLMPVLAVSRRGRVTPWVQLGAGAVSQTGECPQGGSRPDPACVFDLALGGQLATGLRVRLAPAWSFGGEIGYIRGAEVRQRYVTSQRVAIALRWQ